MGKFTKTVIMRRVALVVAVSFMANAEAWAGPFEDAQAAYQRGEYETSLRLWRSLAEEGEARAQLRLAMMYDIGNGVAQDIVEAVRWYGRAAEQGLPAAQAAIGTAYARGEAVSLDYTLADMWLTLAASRLGGVVRAGVNRRLNMVQSYMTPAQLTEARRMVREWEAAHPALAAAR
jgi:TPR repeat protein